MSVTIRLASPSPATPAARRPNYFAGRSLDASDFELLDAHIDDRLAALRTTAPGAVWGLDVSSDSVKRSVTVAAGLGLGFAGPPIRLAIPLTVAWDDLFTKTGASRQLGDGSRQIADGLYLLLARAVAYDGLIGPPPDQALLSSGDPMLDLTQQSFVEILLSARLGDAPAGADATARALAFNLFTGGLTWATLGQEAQGGAPLAAVLLQTVKGAQDIVVNVAAGRLPAGPAPLDAMLLAQSRRGIGDALTEAGADPTSADWQSALRERFRYLPAAGELPVGMFSDSAAPALFHPGTAVYLEFIRASQAQHFLVEARGGPGIDLANPSAEAVTLALAVPDSAWNRNLIDHPRADPVMAADLHLAYARARRAQDDARAAWIALYGGLTAWVESHPQALAFLIDSAGAGQNLSNLLNFANLKDNASPPNFSSLPVSDVIAMADTANQPGLLLTWAAGKIADIGNAVTSAANNQPPAPPPPPAPVPAVSTDSSAAFFALGYQIAEPEPASADPAQEAHAPAASDELLAPLTPYLPPNSTFADWSQAIGGDVFDPDLMQPLIDAGLFAADADAPTRADAIAALLKLTPDSGDPGALAVLAGLQLFYALLTHAVAEQQRRIAALNTMLALQRQHLDMSSVYISGLAGGIPTDGSGMSVARTLPFIQLTPPGTAQVATQTVPPVATSSAGGYVNLQTNINFRNYGVPSVAGKPRTLMSLNGRTTAAMAAIAPTMAVAGTAISNSANYSAAVAAQVNTLSQGPQFQAQLADYGLASHITGGATLYQFASTGLSALQTLMESQLAVARKSPTLNSPVDNTSAAAEAVSYANSTAVARALLADMASVEATAQKAESAYLLMRDRMNSLEARIQQAQAAVATAQDALRAALARASSAAGDYASAQKLAQDELARVLAAVDARQIAIAAATGLFYRRELQTLVSARAVTGLNLLADSTSARPDFSGAPTPPAALQPFVALLQEAPLNDWVPLRGAWNDLPDFEGLTRLAAFRQARLANWSLPAPAVASVVVADFRGMIDDTRSAFQPRFNATWPVSNSLALTQAAAFAILSPPDIGVLSFSRLRAQAEALRAQLEPAAGALYAALSALPPATRFDLASRARNKSLALLDFSQWPLPSTLDAPAAATARKLAALVGWIAGQLDKSSSSAGQTALANLVAAAVMIAAYSDPNEAVSGAPISTGAAPRPGWPIRGVLNGRPAIGSLLDLYDDNQTLAGVLRVEDHDATGSTFSVVHSFSRNAINGAWSIVSRGRIARLPS